MSNDEEAATDVFVEASCDRALALDNSRTVHEKQLESTECDFHTDLPSLEQCEKMRAEMEAKAWQDKSPIERIATLKLSRVPVYSLDCFVTDQIAMHGGEDTQ